MLISKRMLRVLNYACIKCLETCKNAVQDVCKDLSDATGETIKLFDKWDKLTSLLELDHYIPKTKGGLSHPFNCVLTFRSVNRSFSNRCTIKKMQWIGQKVSNEVEKHNPEGWEQH